MEKLRIYGNTSCGYTQAANAFCQSEKLDFVWHDIEHDQEAAAEYQKLSEQYGHFSTPLIMAGDEFIGGYTELQMVVKQRSFED